MHLLVNPPAFAFLLNLQELLAYQVSKRGAMIFSFTPNHDSGNRFMNSRIILGFEAGNDDSALMTMTLTAADNADDDKNDDDDDDDDAG